MKHLKSSFRKLKLWSIRRSYEWIWSFPLANVIWKSEARPQQFPNQWDLFNDLAIEPNLYRITRFTWSISYGCDMPTLLLLLFYFCVCVTNSPRTFSIPCQSNKSCKRCSVRPLCVCYRAHNARNAGAKRLKFVQNWRCHSCKVKLFSYN